MKNCKKIIIAVLLILAAAACLTSCGKKHVDEFSIGEGLPTWYLSKEYYAAELPDDAAEQDLYAIYKTDEADDPDVYVYRYEKQGKTLEDMGNELAGKYKVFCNMINYKNCPIAEDDDTPVANVTYYDTMGEEHYIVRTYIFEGSDEFVKLCLMNKTSPVQLGKTEYNLQMINGFESAEETDSAFPYEEVYKYDNHPYLPTVRIRQLPKDCFTENDYSAEALPETAKAEFAQFAADGWSMDEIIAVYKENFDLLKGEVIHRNGFDTAFIGFIEDGIFYVRAFLDLGDDYVIICAEGDAFRFQHVVNALIDTIY